MHQVDVLFHLAYCFENRFTIVESVVERQMKLFKSMLRSTHCIHQLLPPLKFIPMKLRTSHCVFVLLYCHYSLYKHCFTMYI